MEAMNAMDTVSASLAECFVTIDGKRYNFMQLYQFESKMEINTSEVPILGRTGKGNKATGWTGTWSATAHYNQSVIRGVLYEYKKTGRLPEIEIQATNEDPSSRVGRQTIIHKGVIIKGGVLAKFDADAEFLDEDIEGTFDDWDMPEKFALLPGME
jgi:hypothetical protein